MSLHIEQITNKRQLQALVKFPWQVYADDPLWVPPLYHERLEFVDKQRHPFYEHAEVDFFLAQRGGRVLGTIAAVLNHRHNEFHEENVAHFGLFEVLPDAEAAAALLATVCAWAERRGVDKILGPVNLSTNEECGLLVGGFDSAPLVMMTYNPACYADYVTDAGFTKAMDLWAWRADIAAIVNHMPPKLVRVVNKVKERYGLHIRNLDLSKWDEEVELVRGIYNSAWSSNWGFVPMTDAEFDHLAHGLRPIIDPAVAFAVEKDGETVGFALSLPDVNKPLHRFHPGPNRVSSHVAAAYLFLNRYQTTWLRVLVLGVIEQFRGCGIDALMYYETVKAAATRDYRWAEASWILENNDMMNRGLEMLGAQIYKTYRVYEKALGGS